MSRLRTTPVQRSAFRMGLQRLEDAFVRRDTRLLPSPFASQSLAVLIGCAIVGFIGVVGLLINFVSPNSTIGDSNYIVTKDGGQYVKFNDVWHPVTNPLSARLITGSGNEPKRVGNDALKNERIGLPMGIASAPQQILATDVEKADTTVCSVELGAAPNAQSSAMRIETAVIADSRPETQPLDIGKASLVTIANKSRYWLLFEGKRAEISMNNDTVRAALGINKEVEDNATVVSPKLLNAIPAVSSMNVPRLTSSGSPSTAVQGYDVGTVITQEMPGEPSVFYVVTDKGIQPINEVVGRILVTAGSEIVRNPSVTIINNADRDNEIDQTTYPSRLPEFVDDEVMCVTWLKESNTAKSIVDLTHAKSLIVKGNEDYPDITRSDMATTISGGDGPSADRWYTGNQGKGWFYRTTDLSKESITEGPVWYVSAEGIRYPIGGDTDNEDINSIVELLGLSEIKPVLIPWQYLTLLPEGQTLSPKNAMTLHETITPPDNVLTPEKQKEEENAPSEGTDEADNVDDMSEEFGLPEG